MIQRIDKINKIGFISDTHFNIFRKNSHFFGHIFEMIDLFLKECDSRGVDNIIIPGDIFHIKQQISTEGLDYVNSIFKKLAENYHLTLIPGNHDIASVNDRLVNLVNNYEMNYNTTVFNDYTKVSYADYDLHFMPYFEEKQLRLKLKEIKLDKTKKNYLIAHMGIHGFIPHATASAIANKASAQIKSTSLKDFDRVISGHYHGHQEKGNIIYVSSPLQQKHGDEFDEHGFVFFDPNDNTWEFAENTSTPQYITIDFTKDEIKKIKDIKNHYIRIFIRQPISRELQFKLKTKLMKNNFDVKYIYDIETDNKIGVIEAWQDIIYEDEESLIKSWLDKLSEENKLLYDKKELLNVIGIPI